MIPARPPALVSWENSSANNAYVFTSPAPLSGNRSVLRTNTLAASDARFGITVTQNIPSSGSGEPSAAHFPESSPPSPCGLRLDSLRSLRWEFVARACPAGAREATLGSIKTPLGSFALRIGTEKIRADLANQISGLRNRVTLKGGNRVSLIEESSHSFGVRTLLLVHRRPPAARGYNLRVCTGNANPKGAAVMRQLENGTRYRYTDPYRPAENPSKFGLS